MARFTRCAPPSLGAGLLASAITLSLAGCAGTSGGDPGQPITVEAPLENPTGEFVDPPRDQDPATDPETDPETAPEETAGLVLSGDACQTDADCVPAACCHATACVGRTNAPDCSDTMCTMECRFGTLDCGGACSCHEGRCAARLSDTPRMLPSE